LKCPENENEAKISCAFGSILNKRKEDNRGLGLVLARSDKER